MTNFEILTKGFELIEDEFPDLTPSNMMHEETPVNSEIDEIGEWASANLEGEELDTVLAFVAGFKDVKFVDSFGGEDMGSDYYAIYTFPNFDNMIVKFDGWYQSYNGADFQDFFEVVPKEVMKVEYTKK